MLLGGLHGGREVPLPKPTFCSPNRAAMSCGLHGWVLLAYTPTLPPNALVPSHSEHPAGSAHTPRLMSLHVTHRLLPTQPSECPIHQGPSHPSSLAATGTTPLPPLVCLCLCPCPSNWDGGSLRARPILCPAHTTSAAGCMNEAQSQDRQPVFCPL